MAKAPILIMGAIWYYLEIERYLNGFFLSQLILKYFNSSSTSYLLLYRRVTAL